MAKALKFDDDSEWKEPKEVGCSIKILKGKVQTAAAKTAVSISPANAPMLKGLTQVLDDETYEQVMSKGRALLTTKYWGPKDRTLGVSFMETTTQALRDKIISHMNAWYDHGCCIKFAYSASQGEVRISRGRGGYWSYLGTDVLHIPKGQQTMNLEGFVLSTPESEYRRVVRHETGHTLGEPHEHMRAAIVALLDVAKTIDYFKRTQGWSEEEVRQQVLVPIEEKDLLDPPPADANSIMCYQLPGSITKNGQPIPGGLDIDASDEAYIKKIYPQSAAPPVDPPTKPPDAKRGMIGIDADALILTCSKAWTVRQS